jgi:hypothetical protein
VAIFELTVRIVYKWQDTVYNRSVRVLRFRLETFIWSIIYLLLQ